MLHLISPAKTFDLSSDYPAVSSTKPRFLTQSQSLIKTCRALSETDLMQLMKISPALATLNATRFANWHADFTPENAKPAIFAFNGDVYVGLDAKTLSTDDFTFAQTHLRILSGLYGLLKPLDLIQAYRLEMGVKLRNEKGQNLYQFWQDTLTNALNTELETTQHRVLINLASNEYFKVINEKMLAAPVIKPVFLDYKNGVYKVISFNAKKARGLMSRFIIESKIDESDALKTFQSGGYTFDSMSSDKTHFVFKRQA